MGRHRESVKYVTETSWLLEYHIVALPEVLHSLARFFRGSRLIERAEFRTFVEEALARHAEIYSLQWRPWVPAAERAGFEAGCAPKVSRISSRDATPAGRLVRGRTISRCSMPSPSHPAGRSWGWIDPTSRSDTLVCSVL